MLKKSHNIKGVEDLHGTKHNANPERIVITNLSGSNKIGWPGDGCWIDGLMVLPKDIPKYPSKILSFKICTYQVEDRVMVTIVFS